MLIIPNSNPIRLEIHIDLTEFAHQWVAQGSPWNTHPWSGRVVTTDAGSSTVVWSAGTYTVELYLLSPGVHVPLHAHPFDTCTRVVGGSLFGVRREPGERLDFRGVQPMPLNEISSVLRAGAHHAFQTGVYGAVAQVFAKWPREVTKDSAALKYLGPPIGEKHARLLASQEKK